MVENKKKHQHAIVIGAGFGGIASALRLRAKGYNVTIMDQCSSLGGRAQTYVNEGFKHDAGPTVITAPFLIEELFSLFEKKMSDYLTLVPLNPWYRFIFSNGCTFDYGGTVEDTLKEIQKFNPGDTDGYLKLLKASEKIFDIGFTKLADKPFHQFFTMLSTLPDLIRLKSYKNVWKFVAGHIKDPHLRQAFSIQPLLVGGNPFDTTSIYGLIHFLERRWGIQFAMGGTSAIVTSLEKLMIEEGIHIKLETSVNKLIIENALCKGVELKSGDKIYSDITVSNADPAFLYKNMIDKTDQNIQTRLKLKSATYSMGLFVLYFGTKRQYKNVAHHTIIMGESYKKLLDDIFHKKTLNDDFSMYLHRPTATDSSFAPEACDSFYVLVPVPNNLSHIDWSIEGPRLREKVIKALEQKILPKLSEFITADFYKTPDDFAQQYSSEHGAGFSIAPILRQSAWFRFHNRAEGIKNLYLCGAGTHPGAGLPGVISSAKVLDHLIKGVA